MSEFVDILKFKEKELEILEGWEKSNLYQKIQSKESPKGKFVFLEGPPTANGMPHIGHVLTRVIKDVFLRQKTMTGYQVSPRIGGWDCHGLPVEIEIEKELGFTTKDQIEKFGIKEFNDRCKQSVLKYTKEWKLMSERLGFLLNMENSYVTMTNEYIESVWWTLKHLYDKKLLFKGFKIIPQCPRCETSLSSHEVALGYREAQDPSIYIKFKIKDKDNQYLLAWTTTPWTLISNLLLAVKNDADYVRVDHNGEQLIFCEDLVERVLGETPKILERMKGRDLVGLYYEPLVEYTSKAKGDTHRVVDAWFVNLEEGTGIVHCAPAFGEEDYDLCNKLGIPVFNPVKQDGTFIDEVPLFGGMFVKDADPHIIEHLEDVDKLLKSGSITHTYPFCWRCDSPLLYYAHESWFIKMSSLRKNLVDNNQLITWQPAHLKDGRFGNFIDEAKDWALSRNRYWGTPLPIWNCENKDCNHQFAIGSIKELKDLSENYNQDELDLHVPWVNELPIKCPKCGNSGALRELYVIDAWYDSGAAFLAQWHYPFENEEVFNNHYPVNFITEAIDQTRGWFYTLHAISTALFDKPSFLSCLTMGHILDEDGEKMSKSKGNAISPDEAVGYYGADALRWYLFSTPTWRSTRFSPDLLKDNVRNFQMLLWNVMGFYRTYSDLDAFDPAKSPKIPLEKRPEIDRYIISRLHSLIKKSREAFDELSIHVVAGAINTFLSDDLSQWWIRRSRRRFWEKKKSDIKIAAYNTLYDVLGTLLKLIAPMVPFTAEYFYSEIITPYFPDLPENVHLCYYPLVDEMKIDKDLETEMKIVKSIIAAGRSIRSTKQLKNRLPLAEATIIIPEKDRKSLEKHMEELKKEMNVKKVIFKKSEADFQQMEVKLNFKTVGPKFKKDSGLLVKMLNNLTSEELKELSDDTNDGKASKFVVEGKEFTLEPGDVNFTYLTVEDVATENFSGGQVYLNLKLTPDLIDEGLARDIVRRIQAMRKDAGLAYDDKIKLKIKGDEIAKSVMSSHKEFIKYETLADELELVDTAEIDSNSWQIKTADDRLVKFDIKLNKT
jgi:isoleucyl-tRNA synthetase